MSHNLYLSANETKALHLFSEGKSSQFVENECVIPLSGMGFFTAEIRRKTGISSLLNHKAVGIYTQRHLDAIRSPGLSRDQEQLTRLWLGDNSPDAIAKRMQKPVWELPSLYDKTLKRAGIFSRDDRAIRFQLRLYLACFHLHNPPPTGTKLRLLKMYAEGKTILEMVDITGERELFIRVTLQDAYNALGLQSKGRGAVQQLACAWVRAQETLKEITPVTMDDPAF